MARGSSSSVSRDTDDTSHPQAPVGNINPDSKPQERDPNRCSLFTQRKQLRKAERFLSFEKKVPAKKISEADHVTHTPAGRAFDLQTISNSTVKLLIHLDNRPAFRRRTNLHSKNGSPSLQGQGHFVLCAPLLSRPPRVAQDHPRAGRRPHLQAGQEGCHSFPDRCCPP
jgi:hypothetical protein